MPFTPSHAVVALPFVRTPLIPAAIAIGAMTPDLPLFTRGFPLGYGRTHDPLWLPATMVLAFALLLVWRCLIRPAAADLTPTAIAARLPVEWERSAGASLRETIAPRAGAVRGGLLLAASLAIGVLSHIVWDLFTHEDRWGTRAFPWLENAWGILPAYKWLQHGSTVIGLAIIGIWVVAWLARRTPRAEVSRAVPAAVRWSWWMSLPVFLIGGWVIGLSVFGPLDDDFTVAHLAYRVLPPACALWGLLSLALCVVVQRRRVRRRVTTLR
ncbi:DUF4184 family protein [Microbacterium koreense]|uniref:DUF4184 family protein n=1 Tax=Microbacterium koreense TaxID=323761 RepID=A0ABW2ZT43_9MICO